MTFPFIPTTALHPKQLHTPIQKTNSIEHFAQLPAESLVVKVWQDEFAQRFYRELLYQPAAVTGHADALEFRVFCLFERRIH